MSVNPQLESCKGSTVPIPECSWEHPGFYNVLSVYCSLHCCCEQHPGNKGNTLKENLSSHSGPPFWGIICKNYLSLRSTEFLSSVQVFWQYFALVCFNESQKKKQNFIIFSLFVFSVLGVFFSLEILGLI